MYTKFDTTSDGGYQLKKQGVLSTVIGIIFLIALSILCFKLYTDNTAKKEFLYFGIAMLLFLLLPINRLGTKLILYPARQLFKYETGFVGKRVQFPFTAFNGLTVFRKSSGGISVGNTIAVNYIDNDKEKTAKIGVNVSAKSQRIINEEIQQIINKK